MVGSGGGVQANPTQTPIRGIVGGLLEAAAIISSWSIGRSTNPGSPGRLNSDRPDFETQMLKPLASKCEATEKAVSSRPLEPQTCIPQAS